MRLYMAKPTGPDIVLLMSIHQNSVFQGVFDYLKG
jgi:hypothetical protein